MNYDVYKNIQNYCTSSAYGLILIKSFLLENYPVTSNVATILACMIFAYSTTNNVLKVENYTKDITEIKKIYDEIIDNYIKLNKIFSLDSPVEIYSMYNYMLYKGYLSKDKNFEFNSESARDIRKISGAEVINGKAVCRHIASMLTDILNISKIQSNVLYVYVRTPTVSIHTDSTTEKQTKEQLYEFVNKYITDEKLRKILTQIIDECGEKIDSFSHTYNDDDNFIITCIGNHAISLGIKDDKIFFLDPTQSRMYKLSQNNNSILVDDVDDKIKIRKGTTALFNKYRDIKTISSNISLPSSTLEEDKLLAEKIKELCKKNLDVFEKFYNENSELYNELSNKLMGCKQRGKVLKKRFSRY